MGHRLLVPLVLVVALAVPACTDTDGAESAPSPWEQDGASWVQGAGTPLAKDLVVPEDAFLAGPVFTLVDPYRGQVVGQQGLLFSASSAAMPGVAQSLYDQGGTATRLVEASVGLCTQYVFDATIDAGMETEFTGDLVDGASSVECAAYDRGNSGFEFELSLEPLTADGTVTGYVRWGPAMALPSATLPDVPDVDGGPSEVAHNIEGYPEDDNLTIVDGSFLAGPPGPGTGTGGYRAVIGVTGDPDEVFDAYVQQGGTAGKGDHTDVTIRGLRIRTFQSGGAGGILYTVTMNQQQGNAWIYVTGLND